MLVSHILLARLAVGARCRVQDLHAQGCIAISLCVGIAFQSQENIFHHARNRRYAFILCWLFPVIRNVGQSWPVGDLDTSLHNTYQLIFLPIYCVPLPQPRYILCVKQSKQHQALLRLL